MHPATWKWKWIFWQVLAPVVGPIVISALVVILWQTGNPQFKADWRIIIDVSPWALTFYAVTLIGATMSDLWPKFSDHWVLGASLIVTAFAFSVALYASLIVIWRHGSGFVPGTPV